MRTLEARLIDIVRDFLAADATLRGVAERHREGTLRFEEIRALVGDDEGAVLYRLKERCHALFRGDPGDGAEVGAGTLFDLAVGSLFHEAMKFRENFYQRTAYGPKVRALQDAHVADVGGLLPEFEKLLGDAAVRMEEALQEASILLRQTSSQLRVLLKVYAGEGRVTRFVVEHRLPLAEALQISPEELLTELYGGVGEAHARAAWSYLKSGFYAEATAALAEAASNGAEPVEMERLGWFAGGMEHYLAGRYAEAVAALDRWFRASASAGAAEAGLARIAEAALSRVGQLVDGAGATPEQAGDLAGRLRAALTPGVDPATAH
jgi:tetratricopeptide (TPR) repeat protein